MTIAPNARHALVGALVAGALAVGAPSALASANAPVRVTVDRTRVDTRLGERFHFTSTVSVPAGHRGGGLVAHLNVVSLRSGVEVDPEDWSSDRTRYLPDLRAGQSATLAWSVKAVNDGDFTVYVVALPAREAGGGDPLAVSPRVAVHVAARTTLNSGGVVPLAVGLPALVGFATLAARRRRRGPQEARGGPSAAGQP
jgi:hypothetical protein